MVYADRMRKAIVGRTGDWLARTSFPWMTTLLAFSISLLAVYDCGLLLSALGVRSLAIKFPLCFLAGYVGYALALGFWFTLRSPVTTKTLMVDAPPQIETLTPWDYYHGDGDPENPFGSSQAEFDLACHRALNDSIQRQGPQALAGWLLILAVLGWLIVVFYRVRYARWYLGELLMLGGKVQHSTRILPQPRPWPTVVAEQTAYEAIALGAHYSLIGLTLAFVFPQATTIAEVLRLIEK